MRVTADPDARGEDLLLAEIQIVVVFCGLAPPTGQVKHHLLLPVLLQQQAKIVELIYTSGQPAEGVY